jgi:hypothetical protein
MSRRERAFCRISEGLALNALELPRHGVETAKGYTYKVRRLGELDLAGRHSAVAKKQGMGDCPT